MQSRFREMLFIVLTVTASIGIIGIAQGQLRIPFDGLRLVYFSETTQEVQERTGIYASWWTTLQFHNVTDSSSILDIHVNGTVRQGGQEQPQKFNDTVTFPTDRDTLIYLRNGGQNNLTIFAGSSSIAIPVLPGFTVDLTRQWDLHDKPLIRTPLGAFSSYRYHTAINSIALPIGGALNLDFYAAYEMNTQVLIAGEAWATINGASAQVAHTEIREANFPSAQGQSRCLIATATYGSEATPQVQFLREFRDTKIDRTFAGASFMPVFNAWYYSFSPLVANQIQLNSNLQSVMRGILSPVLLILRASATIFDLLSPQPEIATLLAGLLASGLIGLSYFSVPTLLIQRRYGAAKRAQKSLLIAFGAGLVGLAVAEITVNSSLAALCSTTLILANLFLFASIPCAFLDRAKRSPRVN